MNIGNGKRGRGGEERKIDVYSQPKRDERKA
jgi:hypothetical protein